MTSDILDVDCFSYRDALSAQLDGEEPPIPPVALAAHLDSCSGCAAYAEAIGLLHRRVRLRPAEEVPDQSDRILARAHPPQAGRAEWVRWALLAVALTSLVLALPALVLGDDAGAATHVARHLGSLTIAFSVGLAYAAWRPVRAFGLLPVAAALAGCFLVTAVIDVAEGNTGALGESTHILTLVGLALLWRLAGSPRRGRVRNLKPSPVW